MATGDGRPRWRAVVYGADETVFSLLADVMGDSGIEAVPHGAQEGVADAVVAVLGRGESMVDLLLKARSGTFPAPVMVLLPFDDGHLAACALRLGAFACLPLGSPLKELREVIRRAAARGADERARSSAARPMRTPRSSRASAFCTRAARRSSPPAASESKAGRARSTKCGRSRSR